MTTKARSGLVRGPPPPPSPSPETIHVPPVYKNRRRFAGISVASRRELGPLPLCPPDRRATAAGAPAGARAFVIFSYRTLPARR